MIFADRVVDMNRLPVSQPGRSPCKVRNIIVPLAAGFVVLGSSLAQAANCGNSGALDYIGHFANDAASIWLSRSFLSETKTFRLESAQQGVYSSTFPIAGGGLHLSLSPSVSNGNGG